MALQIWLPLDGTLENKGCANVTVVNNGATVDTAGKIGSCYSFDGSDDYISIVCPKLNATFSGGTQPFSVAMWVYHADSSRAILMGAYGLPNTPNNSFFNLELSTAHAYRFDWKANPDWYPNNTNVGSATWAHVVCTYDGTQVKIYLNGSLTATRNGTLATLEYAGPYYLGRDSRTGTTAFNGKMNDFRVYDHCLSAAEVKEISKGLVLHYKLSPHHDVDTLSNWLYETGERSVPRATSTNNRIDYMFDERLLSTTDTSFTAEFDAKGTASNMVIDVYFRDTNVINASAQKTLTTDWAHYTLSFTSTVATAQVFSIRLYSGASSTAYFKNVKVTSANMPVNDTKVIDSSGYGHHGTAINTIGYSDDSPKYTSSCNLTASSSYITGNYFASEFITFSLWVKFTTLKASHIIDARTSDSGYQPFYYNGTNSTPYIQCGGTNGYPNFNYTFETNRWYYVCIRYDSSSVKCYVDGIQVGTSSSGKGTALNAVYSFYLATRFNQANYSDVYISDFRIYCTALSAEDILDLYHTSAKIDKTGKVHTFELVEDAGTKVTKTGIVEGTRFFQNGYVFKEGGSIVNFKPGEGVKNSCSSNIKVEFTDVADFISPIAITIDFDFTWTDFAFQSEPAGSVLLQAQGTNRLRSDGTWKWQGRNCITANVSALLRNAVNSATSGSQHITVTDTITAEWFETYDASNFSFRCDYSDGNGTLTVTNFKVTLGKDITKFNSQYISANEFIEK